MAQRYVACACQELSESANSATSVEDGLCSIQVLLIQPAIIAHASSVQIYEAASALVGECAAGDHSTGGLAVNIGALTMP